MSTEHPARPARVLKELWLTLVELWAEHAGRVILSAVLVTLGVGTVFYSLVERWSVLDSLYFTVVTLTTVGYGDLSPTKPVSKIFTIVFIFIGVAFILSFLDYMVRRTAQRRGLSSSAGEKPDLEG